MIIRVNVVLNRTVVVDSVTVNNNSPIQDYVHLDDQTQPTFEMTPGFKPFTALIELLLVSFMVVRSHGILDFFRLYAHNYWYTCKKQITVRPLHNSHLWLRIQNVQTCK